MNTRASRNFAALAAAGAASLVGIVVTLHACGPWLPEQILMSRQAILRTPVGDFTDEVVALTEADGAPALPPGCVRAAPQPPPGGLEVGTPPDSREINELRDALTRRGGLSPEQRENLAVAYGTFRAELEKRARQVRPPDDVAEAFLFTGRAHALRTLPVPPTPPGGSGLPPVLAEGLPGEWADYLEGAYRFWYDDLPGARAAWERLLARPQAERLSCSTRAAYMLARVLEDSAAPLEESVRRYQRVRELRAGGCRDPFDLVADSLGWEARLRLKAKDHPAALRLYYLQAVTGAANDFVGSSLRTVACEILEQGMADPAAMAAAARDPFVRRVVALYLGCHRSYEGNDAHALFSPDAAATPAPEPPGDAGIAKRTVEQAWLDALHAAGVEGGRETVPLAWAAYGASDYTGAAAWLEKAPADDGFALWLRAKLALRDGKATQAAGFFARAVQGFPIKADDTSEGPHTGGPLEEPTAFRSRQFHADLGILSLARSDYAQALTALLKSGFWGDAAYIAERVLTVDELRGYVRAHYPQAPPARALTPAEAEAARDTMAGDPPSVSVIQQRLVSGTSADPTAFSLRYLLARRLARAGRYAEAREFYPAVLWPKFDELTAARKTADAARQPGARRADALWRAAKITRHLGMELFGAENDPDWFVYTGAFASPPYRDVRRGRPLPDDGAGASPAPSLLYVPPVSQDEQRRVDKDQVQPEKRFHYRYQAADLAWRAAALMPDQEDATARVLAAGGLWLESMDEAKLADRFYLAILRRCGRTDLGREADKTGQIPGVPHEDP